MPLTLSERKRKTVPKATGMRKAVLIIMRILIILMIITALSMAGYLIWHACFRNVSFSDGISGRAAVNRIVSDNISVAEPDAESINSTTDFDVRMNAEWTFRNGKSSSDDAYVGNPESNSNSVFFDVVLAGTNEKIYTSPVIPVGSHLEDIMFEKKLPKGKYNAVLTYNLLGADGETVIGALQMALKITVQS